MNLDQVTYGNPSNEQLPYLEQKTFVDELFNELSSYRCPANSSEGTKEELNSIVDCLNTVRDKDEYLTRYFTYDRGLISYIKKGLTQNKENADEIERLVDSIIQDTLPLLTKLKFYFQRPRPYQLAEYYKLKLFPYKSYSANTPSFPSGHSFQGKLLCEVIGNKFPEIYSYMQNLFNDICYSRVYMGLHYQSDIDGGIFCAERILDMKEFKLKYKL